MLSASDLDSLCADQIRLGNPCPASALARTGQIDLPTYAEHRIRAKDQLRKAQTVRNEEAATEARNDMDRWRANR